MLSMATSCVSSHLFYTLLCQVIKAFSLCKSAFEKGELVLHSSDGKIGVIDYGPDSDGDYKVKYHDGNRSSYVKASGLKGTAFVTNKGTFTKGELVLHLSDKRAGVIDSGPDSDGDYKVKYDDGSQSGYVKADGLKGTSFIMSPGTELGQKYATHDLRMEGCAFSHGRHVQRGHSA